MFLFLKKVIISFVIKPKLLKKEFGAFFISLALPKNFVESPSRYMGSILLGRKCFLVINLYHALSFIDFVISYIFF
jgi:hypothetical protein